MQNPCRQGRHLHRVIRIPRRAGPHHCPQMVFRYVQGTQAPYLSAWHTHTRELCFPCIPLTLTLPRTSHAITALPGLLFDASQVPQGWIRVGGILFSLIGLQYLGTGLGDPCTPGQPLSSFYAATVWSRGLLAAGDHEASRWPPRLAAPQPSLLFSVST